MSRKTDLDGKVDIAVVAVVMKNEYRTQMAGELFQDALYLKPLAFSTLKEVEKYLKYFMQIEELNKIACQMMESDPENVKERYPIHHTMCNCVHCNQKGLGIQDVPAPPSPPVSLPTNILYNRSESNQRYLRRSRE